MKRTRGGVVSRFVADYQLHSTHFDRFPGPPVRSGHQKVGSWSFTSSQRRLASPLLIGIGGSRRGDFCCSAVWLWRAGLGGPTLAACPTREQGSQSNGPGGAALATCMLFSAPERIPGRPGRAQVGPPAHSPGARRDFWLSGIAHLQVAANPAAAQTAQPTRGGGLPLQQGSSSTATAFLPCIFFLPAARFDVGDSRPQAMPTHATGRAICHALPTRTGFWHVELAVCSGLQWSAVVLGLG